MAEEKKTGFLTSAKQISTRATERIGKEASRSLHIAGISCVGNTLIGLGKLLMGIVSLSFFTCASAFYTFGMVIAKCCVLAGIVKEENTKAQYRYYKLSGLVLIASSILYIVYSIRLLSHPATSSYHMYVALAIATFTFTELTINIRGVIIYRHNHTPLVHAIKMINLAASLICLVLTQTAVLSFSTEEVYVHPYVNGFMGILMGGAATLLGLNMIVRISKIQHGKNYGTAYRQVRKLMKKEGLKLKLTPVYYVEQSKQCKMLYVKIPPAVSEELFVRLQSKTQNQLEIMLLDANLIPDKKMEETNHD